MGRCLDAGRCEEIRATVADLIEDWGIAEYPFSVWSLVRKIGVRVVPYSALPEGLRREVEGYWPDAITIYPPDWNPARTVVFYNTVGRDRERVRFTVAHELGHLVLEHPDTGEERYEHEADFFANYLLVPAPLALRYSALNADSISYDFQVSYSCARSARDRARNRLEFGPREKTEYELRILAASQLRGGGQLAQLK